MIPVCQVDPICSDQRWKKATKIAQIQKRPKNISTKISRQKCAYFMIFATKERVCCDFWDKSAYFVIFATKMRVCCDFHDNNCVFGISGSNSCISQVFSAHTCTIHWILPTKTVNKGLFSFCDKYKVLWSPIDPPPLLLWFFPLKIPFFFKHLEKKKNDGFP